MNAPDYVQNAYQRVQSDGLPGSFADANPTYVRSFVAESAEIPFGVVVSIGSSYGPPPQAILGGGTVAATAGYMQGAATIATIAAFQAITDGAIKITIDGTVNTLTTLDFSAAQTFADVATVISTALTAAKGTVSFSPVTGCFRITSATTGASSSVTEVANNTTGTSIIAELGLAGTPITVAGTASHTAIALGVVARSLVFEGGCGNKSNITVVREGDVGAVLFGGAIKVLAKETVAAGASVYFDNTTGEIYGTSSAGRTQLGTSKFLYAANAGEVAIINVVGL